MEGKRIADISYLMGTTQPALDMWLFWFMAGSVALYALSKLVVSKRGRNLSRSVPVWPLPIVVLGLALAFPDVDYPNTSLLVSAVQCVELALWGAFLVLLNVVKKV